MSVTPKGDFYPMPGPSSSVDLATRVTRIAGLVDGADVNGLIGWAVNCGAQGAVESIAEWALLPEEERFEVAKKRGHQLRSSAGAQGTKVHQIIATMFEGTYQSWMAGLVDNPGVFDALRRFLDLYQPVYIDHERTLYGTDTGERWWAGTTDLLCTLDGRGTALVDWKTGKPHLAYTAQLGGYSLAEFWSADGTQWEKTHPVDAALTVYLSADGSFVVDDLDLVKARQLWLAAWRFHNDITYINKEQQP